MTDRVRRINSATLVSEDPADFLRACISPVCFWSPEQLGPQPAWLEHAPFAFWLIGALHPRTLVELGTHGGYSYFTFCQAVQRLRLDTRCYAVDTWKGDEQAGYYDEPIYHQVRAHHDRLYSAFSTLVRSSFDEARTHFSDGTIDLLHIDGCHFYEQVKHDFETWRPKLSDRGIVLFHDTNVREGDFGVFRLWENLRSKYPHFEFMHGHGLGVLGVGRRLSDQLRILFAATENEEAAAQVRAAYSRLGSAISLQLNSQKSAAEAIQLATELSATRNRVAELNAALERGSAELIHITDQLSAARANIAGLEIALQARSTELTQVVRELSARSAETTQLNDAISVAQTKARHFAEAYKIKTEELEAIRTSNSWRVTVPLRWIAGKLPWLTRQVRRCAKLIWWTVSLRLPTHIRTIATRSDAGLLGSSSLFDQTWYLETYPDVRNSGLSAIAHYLNYGWRENRKPHPLFDPEYYFAANPDLPSGSINPLLHFLRIGIPEGRSAISPKKLLDPVDANRVKKIIGLTEPSTRCPPGSPPRPIRTLMFTHNLNLEGAPLLAFDVAVGLRKRGVIEPVVSSRHDGPLRQLYEKKGIPVLIAPDPLAGIPNDQQIQHEVLRFAKQIERFKPELVYANTILTYYAIASAHSLNTPSIWNIHESEAPECHLVGLGIAAMREAMRCYDRAYQVVFGSEHTLKRSLPFDRSGNFRTIHHGLNVDWFNGLIGSWSRDHARRELGLQPDELMFVSVGTVSWRKGQRDIIEALAQIDETLLTKTQFFLVGDRPSPYSNELHAACEALPSRRRKRIHIVPETDQLGLYYRAADIFLSCSRIECYPRVILEAMMLGLAIIATPAYGVSEQLRDGFSALFYEPGHIVDLIKHIRRLVLTSQERTRLGENARASLQELNDYDRMLDQYAKVFREAWLCGHSRSAA